MDKEQLDKQALFADAKAPHDKLAAPAAPVAQAIPGDISQSAPTSAPVAGAAQSEKAAAANAGSLPNGWSLVRGGDDIQLRRADGKWCGYSQDIDSPAHQLTLQFLNDLLADRVPATSAAGQPELTVWYGPMPESNGKSNFTAILMRKGGDKLDNMTDGITIDRSEYPDRVRYEADRVRYLIGELSERPFILDYDADKHSGYVPPADRAAAVGAGDSYLLPGDLAALNRFQECATDFDAGGHDVSKAAMARLREIGVVQSIGFGRHQTTAFGDYVLERVGGEPVTLPLKTLHERNADARTAAKGAGDSA